MTSTFTRIITVTLVALALSAPVATAMPLDAGKPSPPVKQTTPAPAADDGSPSPLVFIVPTLVVIVMLGAAASHLRSSPPTHA
ncbi:MAG TPA: hypothetical protein VFM58_00675 [Solirubrobacteraceae bacterium]|nr:hypothetical protein [Solirubrobacteraceae bacterium]